MDVPYGSNDGGAHVLYVAGYTNFDLAYDNGLFYALNLDAMDPDGVGTGFVPAGLANGTGWDGTPGQVPDLDSGGYWDREHGVVITDSMGSELRLTQTSSGTQRLFLASRFSNVVTAIEASGDAIGCYGGGTDCTNAVAAPPLVIESSPGANQILDVFGVSNEITTEDGERDVFITHMRDQAFGSGGVYNNGIYGNNFNQIGTAYLIRQNVDDPSCRLAEPLDSTGTSSSVALTSGGLIYTLFTGRYGGLTNAIRELTLPEGGCSGPDAGQVPIDPNPFPNLFTVDLSAVTKGNDGRGMALSTDGKRVFAIIRNPDALVVLGIDGFTSNGLLVHAATAVPLPPGPAQVLAIPRTNSAGEAMGDLVAVSCSDSELLTFYDDQIGTVTAALPGVGDEPFGLAAAARTLGVGATAKLLPGVRIFVSAFGSGQIAVVDVPNPLDASSAQVVAMIGTREDTSISPINPNSTIFTTSTLNSPAGLP